MELKQTFEVLLTGVKRLRVLVVEMRSVSGH
jgi:hypothetical protein